MRVLVVGGSGLLGRLTCELALASGHEVFGTHLRRRVAPAARDGAVEPADTAPALLPGVHWEQLDLAGPDDAIHRLVRSRPVDAVVNAAYVVGGEHLPRVTGTAPGVIAAACAAAAIRFVHVSSDAVFDGALPAGETYGEADPPNPVHDYGRAKVQAEQLVLHHDPEAAIVRTSLLYPGTPDQQVRDALGPPPTASTTRAPMTFFTDELRNPCRAADLASLLVWLATDPAGREVSGLVHAVGADTVSRFDLARLFAVRLGLDPAGLVGGRSPLDGPPRPRNCALRSDRGLPGLPLPGVRELLSPSVS